MYRCKVGPIMSGRTGLLLPLLGSGNRRIGGIGKDRICSSSWSTAAYVGTLVPKACTWSGLIHSEVNRCFHAWTIIESAIIKKGIHRAHRYFQQGHRYNQGRAIYNQCEKGKKKAVYRKSTIARSRTWRFPRRAGGDAESRRLQNSSACCPCLRKNIRSGLHSSCLSSYEVQSGTFD